MTLPGLIGLLSLRPSDTQRQEQGETPDAAHMHHDAACTQSRLLQKRETVAGGQKSCKRTGEDEEEAARSGWAERMNEWGGIEGGREFENGRRDRQRCWKDN